MALNWDGVDDRVSTASHVGVPTGYPLTFAAVLKTPGSVSQQTLFSLGVNINSEGYDWVIRTNNKIRFTNENTGLAVTSSGTISLNAWVFLGVAHASATSHRFFCYNYETRTVVFNETSAVSVGALVAPAAGDDLTIGAVEADFDAFADFYTGEMMYTAVYAKDFTIASGDALLALAFLGPYSLATPAVLYGYNEMTGTTTQELIGTGDTGTLSNFPATPWTPAALPGPWWARGAQRVIRPQAAAPAGDTRPFMPQSEYFFRAPYPWAGHP